MTEITGSNTKDDIITAALEFADYQQAQSVERRDVRNIAITCLAIGFVVGVIA